MNGAYPPLPKEEQERLLALWRAGDRRAKDKLFRSMMGFVASCALRYRGVVGNRFDDLLQVGYIAMSHAIDGWEPERGTLITYARQPIRWAMSRFLLQDSLIIQKRTDSYANRKLLRSPLSLDAVIDEEAGEDTLLDRMASPHPPADVLLELRERHEALRMAVAELPLSERTVMERRWLTEDEFTLADLGAARGLTRERIRQIEESALKKIERSIDKVGT